MEKLELYKIKIERLTIENEELVKKVNTLENQNSLLESKMLYFREFKNLSYKTNRFMSFIRSSRNKSIADQAVRLWDKYWNIVQSKESFFSEQPNEEQSNKSR